jgi:hypothetical protein
LETWTLKEICDMVPILLLAEIGELLVARVEPNPIAATT